MKLTEEQLENVKEIQFLLDSSKHTFFWGDSPQGYKFWDDVDNALIDIIRLSEKKVCKECGREL